MSNQIPVSEGTKRMLDTFQKELLPALDSMRKLVIEVQSCRITFPFYSHKLTVLQKKYNEISIEFFNVVRKLETPDILFKDISENPQNIASYLQFQPAMSKSIADGSNYIEILDRALDRKNESIQNTRTLAIAMIAIFISIYTSN